MFTSWNNVSLHKPSQLLILILILIFLIFDIVLLKTTVCQLLSASNLLSFPEVQKLLKSCVLL